MSIRLPGLESDRILAPFTSWKIGGPADSFAEPEDPEGLRACLLRARDQGWPVLALGGGSNLLIADEGFRGLVVRYLGASQDLEERSDEARFRAGARTLLASAARRLSRAGWAGLEWAEGIPGTIGGAVTGNAGAFGSEMSAVLDEVEAFSLTGGTQTLSASDCEFRYRGSRFKDQDPAEAFVVGATLRLRRDDPERLGATLRRIAAERRSRTPVGLSCGSVFKNPPGTAAGRLIESSGLKGAEEGPAQISPRHANYIVNRGGATSRQVLTLIERARARVWKEFSIALELEVRLVGFGDEPSSS